MEKNTHSNQQFLRLVQESLIELSSKRQIDVGGCKLMLGFRLHLQRKLSWDLS
jgi:hypothetical protein